MKILEYEKIKLKYIQKYQNKIINLRNEYVNIYKEITIKDFIEINMKYRNYIIQMIQELANEFKKIHKIDFCITLSGSLGRNSNTLFSDVDINYLTCSCDYKVIIDIEDKINFIIQDVLKFRGKDKIHSLVVYLPLISNKKINLQNDNLYKLVFDDGILNIPCRKNSKKLLFEMYNSTRNLNDVINYFNSNDTKDCINEWTYCFKFIYSSRYKNIFDRQRKVCNDLSEVQNFKKDLIEDISENDIYIDSSIKKIKNYKLKYIYKTSVLFNFYKLLAIDFRMEKDVNEFNIDCFFLKSKKLDKKIFIYFYKYLGVIQDLQYILDLKQIDLSSHSNNLLNLIDINNDYK